MPKTPGAIGESSLNRLLPYGLLCTIGPSVTAATNLFVVRYVMCRYLAQSRDPASNPQPRDEICDNRDVHALAGSVLAGLATMDGICSLLSSSYVQFLADRYGRRPLMIALPLLATISTLVMPLAYWWDNQIAVWILLAANGIFISASTKSVFVPTLCVADIASVDTRTRYYSRLEAVSLCGPMTAYVLSALLSRYSPIVELPYYVALASQLLAALYAAFVIPETLPKIAVQDDRAEDSLSVSGEGRHEGLLEEAITAPIKPLRLLVPHWNETTRRWSWRLPLITLSLLATTSGTVFIATATLLYLSDKFRFDPENNAWFLAYLTALRLGYLVFVFPLIIRFGRRAYAAWEERKKPKSRERQPLLRRITDPGKQEHDDEANHFDVLVAFGSVAIDAVSLSLVTLCTDVRQVLGSFALYAFGGGDNPSFKSVFVSAVPEEHASEALAALDMVLAIAKLASPPLLGSVYAAFAEVGRPELLYLVAGGFCAAGAVLIAPLVLAGRR